MATSTTLRTRRALVFPAPTEIVPGHPLKVFQSHPAKIMEIPVEGSLKALQELVGGYIEGLDMPLDHRAYGADDKFGMAVNDQATSVWERGLREAGRVHLPGDYLGGTIVVFGPDDGEGNDTPVTDEFIALVKAMMIQVDE